MAGDEPPKEFPDVSQKLSAPKKLSQFERDRQAAEDKKRREEAETAKALKEFEDSFSRDNNDDDEFDGFPRFQPAPTGPRVSGSGFGGPPGRFGGPPRSGPGSLGPVPGLQPPNLKRKRALDEMREAQEAKRDQEDFTAEYMGRRQGREESTPQDHDEEEHVDIATRSTVQLSSLPPSTTEEDVKRLLRGHLEVHSVHLQPPTGPGSGGRKSLAAIVLLSSDTSTPQIDAAVSALKDKYMGRGYSLSISRHLSSTSLQPNMPVTVSTLSAEPFGGQRINKDQLGGYSMRNAPPPQTFAPPGSYQGLVQPLSPANAFVAVQPPLGMETIRAVHTLIGRLVSESDPDRALELEAMLMALPEIQNDERFSFLYDSRSPAGVYYRFLLWNDDVFDTIQARKSSARGPERILDDMVMDWLPPSGQVPFADLSSLGEVLNHESYLSDDEYDDDEETRLHNGDKEGEKLPRPTGNTHLTPLQVAKFSWMLSHMPTSHTRLRKGQVAAVTSFAIKNARVGAEEIVNMLVLNIERPYNSSLCATFDKDDATADEDDDYEPDEELPTIESTPAADTRGDKGEPDDPSQVKLAALYLINDILHSCATAGATNAWKYRGLFETAFKQRKIFQYLGRLEKELGWGRMRSDNWKRKINALFEIWGQANVFALDVFDTLKKDFFDQPANENAEAEITEEAKKEEKWMARFKRIDGVDASPAGSASPAPAPPTRTESLAAKTSDLDGTPMEDLDGEPMDDIDGVPMEDLDGIPMEELDGEPMEGAPMTDAPTETLPSEPSTTETKTSGFVIKGSNSSQPPAPEPPKRRRLAEDMFADSDEE